MPAFGERSQRNLSGCHPDLQRVFNRVIELFDCTVICGQRGEAEQNAAFHAGTSTKKYPESKHNQVPSLAADVVPYPVNWRDERQMLYFAGVVMGVAAQMGVKLRWGGDWNSNNNLNDQQLHDLPHFELI